MMNPTNSIAKTRPTLQIDGVSYTVDPDMSVAAAMVEVGISDFASGHADRKRGVFCGMGVCHECLVTIDGKAGQRSCMTKVNDGMYVTRQSLKPDITSANLVDLCPVPHALDEVETDLLIIGAGPAGLSAAKVARQAGISVMIVDERPAAGGQFFKQPAHDRAQDFLKDDKQTKKGAALIAQLKGLGVDFRSEVLVWGAEQLENGKPKIGCYGSGRAFYVLPQMLIIATGAYECPDPFPGWTLPGVMTVGAAQTLLRSYATLPGERILVAGNGPLNIQVAYELQKAGANVLALADRARAPWRHPISALSMLSHHPELTLKGIRELAALYRGRTSVLWRSNLKSVTGVDRAEEAIVQTPTGDQVFDVDCVLVGGDFAPSNPLSRLLGLQHEPSANGVLHAICKNDGESSNPSVYIVGEAARFGGAHIAMSAGEKAGISVVRKLGKNIHQDKKVDTKLRKARAFQNKMWRIFAPADDGEYQLEKTDIVCRCERVTFGQLQGNASQIGSDAASLKRITRAGMGRCQGHYCNNSLTKISQTPSSQLQGKFAPQMPLRPVPIAALAVEKSEWGGHRRSLLPKFISQVSSDALSVENIETVVIGGGIVGLATAYYLTKDGREVAVLERSSSGGLASGGNAGSLHAQLLSFDYGTRAQYGGGPAAKTLPLQLTSIQLWQELEVDLKADFELKICGGLMVAETEDQLKFLREKTAIERAAGIECELIGRDELERLEPALSQNMISAAYCPQEGKINPLTATRGVRIAAEQNGAQILEQTNVLGLEKDDHGFLIHTSRGHIRAKHVVNAAGAFTSQIASYLGLKVPVFGAPLQMIVTEAATPTLNHLVAHADRHLTLKQADNGTFLIGGGWTAGLDPVHSHPRPFLSSIEGNLWVAQHVLPLLRKMHMVRTWSSMNIDIDGAPIIGEHPDMPGFFNAVTSNGFTLGPIIGRITAALVQNRDPDCALSTFSISRFR